MVVQEITTLIFNTLNNFTNTLISVSPKLLTAILILLIGFIVGSMAGRFIKAAAKRYRLDRKIFGAEALSVRFSDVVALISAWVIYIIFIQSSVEILGFSALVAALSSFLEFLNGMLKGVILILIGYGLAHYIAGIVRRSKVIYSDIMSAFLFFIIVYVSLAIALPLLGIDQYLVNNILLIIIGSIGIGIAIAIGLGFKDIISELTKKYVRTYLKTRAKLKKRE